MRRNVKERRWRLDFSLSFVRIKLQYTSKEPKGGIPTFLPMIEGSCERENSLRSWRHCYIRGTHFLDLLPTLSRLRRQKRTYIPPIPPATQATTRCKSTPVPVRHCTPYFGLNGPSMILCLWPTLLWKVVFSWECLNIFASGCSVKCVTNFESVGAEIRCQLEQITK